MNEPLARCPRCKSPEISGERTQDLGEDSVLKEVFQKCPKCRFHRRLRLTTASIEQERRRLARRIDIRGHEHGSRVSSQQVELQMVRLRNAATHEGLTEEVPELCQPNSVNH